MLINHQQICELIPHTGAMCLLDGVTEWDEQSIYCITASHQSASNPFINSPDGSMDSAILVEYGAQAAAVHAGLLQQGIAGRGTAYIGAVKDLRLHRKRVDSDIDTLVVKARCDLNTAEGAIYNIECDDGVEPIITARIVLVLPAAA